MSPYSYVIAHEFYLDGTGGLTKIGTNGNKYIRPVISLKNETEIENGGDGTPANPYVVKYN